MSNIRENVWRESYVNSGALGLYLIAAAVDTGGATWCGAEPAAMVLHLANPLGSPRSIPPIKTTVYSCRTAHYNMRLFMDAVLI